jgi:lipoprotein-releasing system permease protein
VIGLPLNWPFEAWVGWRYFHETRGHGGGPLSLFSLISITGIALGVAVLITALSIFNGFEREVTRRMLEVVSAVEALGSAGELSPQALEAALRRAAPAEVLATAPALLGDALVIRGDAMRGARVHGIDPDAQARVTGLGASIAPQAFQTLKQPGRNLVIGSALAEQLGVKVGDTLVLTAVHGSSAAAPRAALRSHAVTGLFTSGHFVFDSGHVYCSLDTARDFFGPAAVAGAGASVVHPAEAGALARRLMAADAVRQLPATVQVRDWTQINQAWHDTLQVQKRMVGLIISMIVTVAAFNLVSTLVLSVEDKRADIAIMRTMGASPASIMATFTLHGAATGLAGTAAGVALGLGLSFNATAIVAGLESLFAVSLLRSDVYLIDHMPSDPRFGDVLAVALMAMALSLSAALYPSWKASRVHPVQGLRHE